MRAAGTISLAANSSFPVSGTSSQQTRYRLIVSNLAAVNPVKLCLANGFAFATVFAQTTLDVLCSEDVLIFNPHVSEAVSVELGEVYPRGGGSSSGGRTGGSSGSSSSASSGDTSSDSFVSTGYGTRATQPP
jgi:hypothetical protein